MRFISVGPLSLLAIVVLIGLAVILVPLFIFGLIGKAFTLLGFSWIEAIAIIVLMVLGSMVNIPLYRVRRSVVRVAHDSVAGIEAVAPLWETRIAVNLGGALIPICVVTYLLFRAIPVTGKSLFVPAAIGVLLVAGVSYFSTRTAPGIGIQVPLLIPGVTALLTGALFGGGTGVSAVVIAIVSGVVGVLLGGNIAHLAKVHELEIPMVSIGGSGTFGAVFLCCILPALLAGG
jgi:uncharacterized membrane protein